MAERTVWVFAEKLAKPLHPFSPADVIVFNQVFDTGNRRSVAAEDDSARRGVLAHKIGHPLGFEKIRYDERNAHVVIPFFDLLDESLFGRKIENRSRNADILRDEIQSEARVVETRRKETLLSCDLIVQEFHEVLFTAICIVHAERSENGGKQDFHKDLLRLAA